MKSLWVPMLVGTVLVAMLAAAGSTLAGPRGYIYDPDATPSWLASLAGPGVSDDGATAVKLLKGDVTLVAGILGNAAGNNDLSLVKYVGTSRRWTRRYDGPAHGADGAIGLAISPDGKWVYVAGFSTNVAGKRDLVVVKRSLSSGARKWTRRYDGPAHGDEMCTGVGVDGAGNVVVSGTTLTSSGIQGVVASWTKGGAKRWIWRYDAGGHTITTFNGLLVRSDGGIYVAGMGLAAGGKSVAVTARLRRTGTPVWVRKYFGPENMGATLTGITARPGGGVYVYGDTLTAATAADGLVLRYLPSGKRKRFTLDTAGAGTTNEVFTDLAVTSVKSVVAVGYSQGATQDCHVATYRSDGAMLTSGTSVTPSSNDHYVAVTSDAFGGYYVTGTYHVAAGDCRIRTFRASVLSGGGGWSALWTAVPSIATSPTAIAVRGTRCCVVGHYDAGVGAGVDQIVLFYTY